MVKPVILAVDDESAVLRAVTRDLRGRFGDRFRVMPAESADAALEALGQLRLRNEPVALFLADQRMPQMTGVEFLEEAVRHVPDAKRVLLTAYADTDAAIRAINGAHIDYYLMKPWDPPEEKLYPVLLDLLDEWEASYHPPFEGLRLIGHRWSAQSHHLKDFLARNQVPYQWLDVEVDEEAQRLVDYLGAAQLPVALFPDGSFLTQPSNLELAERVGLQTRASLPFYDLVIVGAGPAGLAAAVYGASEGLKSLLIEREAPGGQAGMSSRIENYLGFPMGLSGGELTRRARDQARKFGAEFLSPLEALSIERRDPYRIVTLSDGSELSCHALLIATGVSYRRLDVPGIEAFTGAGVYYGAAITEAQGCMDQECYIVGGGNSAGQAAMYLSRFARCVTMLIRRDSLSATMSQYLIDQINDTANIQIEPFSQVTAVEGEGRLERLTIYNSERGTSRVVPAAALFIFIGAQPRTDWLKELLACDERGFLLTGRDVLTDRKRSWKWPLERDRYLLEAAVPGIFVAGDVRAHSIKRVASAVGEGAMAVQFVHQYLATL